MESDILLKLALNKASEENNLLEALTIQSLLIKDLNISLISSNTVYEIVKSLNSFGLTEISRDFTKEWIVSKIVAGRAAARKGNKKGLKVYYTNQVKNFSKGFPCSSSQTSEWIKRFSAEWRSGN